MDDAAECKWPQPPPIGINPVRLPVVGGQVRIGGISQRIDVLKLAGQRRWQAVFGEATAISMCGLLAGCCRGGRPLLTVCKQLVWAVAERLETFLDSRLRNAPPPPPLPGVEIQRAGWTTGSAYALRRRLGHYLSCCRTAVGAKPQYISVSTDKSRVHALGLQNMMVCLPSNVAFWAPPQAIVVHGAGLSGGSALKKVGREPVPSAKNGSSPVSFYEDFYTYG